MSILVFDLKLTDIDTIANRTFSSEQTAYPEDNAYDINRRRKVWRSNGCFEIVSGENTIVFREQAGVDITATIADGTYTSDATFLAAIKTALEAVGVGTYVVDRDATTDRIQIEQSVAGGATVFQLMWTDAGSADMAAILGFSTAANSTGALVYEADLLVIHTSEWLKCDFGGPVNPTGFFISGDRNSPLQISPTAVVKLQGSWTDAWDTPSESFTIPYLDYVLGLFRSTGIAQDVSAGYRYWRVQIVDQQNTDGYIQVGAFFLGTHIVTTQGCPAFSFPVSAIDRSIVAISDGGQSFITRKPKTQAFELNWEKLNNESAELLQAFFEQYGLHTSFVIAMDPDAAFSTESNLWARLVKFDREPVMSLTRPGLWDCRWVLREEL